MNIHETPALDAFEASLPGYLRGGSSLPDIIALLRAELAAGNGGKLNPTVAEIWYARLARGDMGRGDVIRAIRAAMQDFAQGE